jgi:hypothetical protein
MRTPLIVAVLAVFLCVPVVRAQQGYVGASIGGANVQAEIDLIPIDEATAGMIFSETEVSSDAVLSPYDISDRAVEFTVGVGGAFRFKHLAVRAELEYFSNEQVDSIFLLSAGIEYRS